MFEIIKQMEKAYLCGKWKKKKPWNQKHQANR
jgi:hypothetical protein